MHERRAAAREVVDDLGSVVILPSAVRRVVSLVPSLTESIAATDQSLLVGATRWCSHPGDLAVTRVGGTKNPDLQVILGLAPDLVLANEEENREPDVAALRAGGAAVYVTDVRTVDGAVRSLAGVLGACGLGYPAWLHDAARAWDRPRISAPRRSAVVPVWRRPWMALGRDTFAGDVLARLGVDNAFAGSSQRYPRIDPESLPPHDVVVLPDEPYRFHASDGPEVFAPTPCVLVSGRHLTWYGPSLVEAAGVLTAQMGAAG